MNLIDSSSMAAAEDVIAWNTDAQNRVIMFKVTFSMVHPVKTLLEAMHSNSKRAALVFVVPKSNVSSCKRQEIVPEATDSSLVNRSKALGQELRLNWKSVG
ncbi:hypothetical protein F443_19614 [Phytophthora nicotianae P1569]|uniref:Uncharacterized protein n=1 Tax=Phytophthora nicotianae P1569 TaxID=1317065 RepID=V9E629_PHYNI|nr:hypothetical protein F443_19614 [Phytophthora nicotianae P1569]